MTKVLRSAPLSIQNRLKFRPPKLLLLHRNTRIPRLSIRQRKHRKPPLRQKPLARPRWFAAPQSLRLRHRPLAPPPPIAQYLRRFARARG